MKKLNKAQLLAEWGKAVKRQYEAYVDEYGVGMVTEFKTGAVIFTYMGLVIFGLPPADEIRELDSMRLCDAVSEYQEVYRTKGYYSVQVDYANYIK